VTSAGSPAAAMDDTTLAARVVQVRERIAAAARRVGRDPASVRLLAVSKSWPLTAIEQMAAVSGLRLFGENRPQELAAKAAAALATDSPVQFTLIGHLQTNKVALVAAHAVGFQALDSLRCAHALDAALQACGRGLDVLIEVNTSGEAAKHGVGPDEVAGLARQMAGLDALRVRGLMTVALNSPEREPVVACFERLRETARRLRDDGVLGSDWAELSMGMSGDYEWAIEHGATTVRLGSALFGPRTPVTTTG